MAGPMDPRGAQPQRNLQTALSEMVNTFGEDGLMELFDRIKSMADPAQYEGMEPIDTTMLPPPDFGDQQPVTTLPPSDENLGGLESYYGYPTKVVQPGTPGGRQLNNSFPGMELSPDEKFRTQIDEAQYRQRPSGRTVGKPRR
jgi:hypothetical protein